MNNQIGKKKAWLLLGVLLGAIFLVIPATNVEVVDQKGLAYIYLDNSIAANSYKTFLDSNGYSVSLIPMQNVNVTNFSIYDMIIIEFNGGIVVIDGWTLGTINLPDLNGGISGFSILFVMLAIFGIISTLYLKRTK